MDSKEKLKTLKDLTSWTCKCNCVTFDDGVCRSCGCDKPKYGEIDYDELKQEAIKWAKDIEVDKEQKADISIKDNKVTVNSHKKEFVITYWIKHFLNISIEELLTLINNKGGIKENE